MQSKWLLGTVYIALAVWQYHWDSVMTGGGGGIVLNIQMFEFQNPGVFQDHQNIQVHPLETDFPIHNWWFIIVHWGMWEHRKLPRGLWQEKNFNFK